MSKFDPETTDLMTQLEILQESLSNFEPVAKEIKILAKVLDPSKTVNETAKDLALVEEVLERLSGMAKEALKYRKNTTLVLAGENKRENSVKILGTIKVEPLGASL
jgi:hypothetical protein